MSKYNPFDKSLEALTACDLSVLTTVHEGWYVEYKAQTPNASSIAKSIAAFANTYGGWLFYGIAEKSGTENVAGSFPGIPRAEVDGTLQRIRQAAAHSLNPSPHFDVRAVWGPADEIGLGADHAVVCAVVPRGHAAPFVHRSGQIYRRVGDGSEPRPETDRFVLDQLWRRGNTIRDDYAEWIDRDLDLSEAEEKAPYLRLLLTPDLWRDQGIWAELTTKRVRDIFADVAAAEDSISSVPYDVTYRTAGGYVGRQVQGNDPHRLTGTWFLRPNLSSEIVLPLPLIEKPLRLVAQHLEGYIYAARFEAALAHHNHNQPRVIDLNFVFSLLAGTFHTQALLLAEAKHSGPLFLKAQLLNVWRTVPFLDVEAVIADQEANGVPVCLRESVLAPIGKGPESFAVIPPLDHIAEAAARKALQAVVAFDPIAAAFGIETGADHDIAADGARPLIFGDLMSVGSRAMAAQTLRNARAASSY